MTVVEIAYCADDALVIMEVWVGGMEILGDQDRRRAIGIGGKVGGVEFGWSRGLGNVTL